MIIEQTVDIPASRRLTLDLPADTPTGAAKIMLSIFPSEKPPKMSRQMRNIMKFYGCLKDSPVFEGDPVAIQRQIRAEWEQPRNTHE